ncbi:ATP-binding protein [Streptomyces sp. V4-01]|uniref:ATP-binding protein n=1 Tax=Actinacidiphila polyblastidii TaxID=3110430 RepID=A0ABU7PC15_9ACTN|nr:ATP-binding protein [Streptomyces sp. V4-01]
MAETRRLLRESLRRWGIPALTDTAELLTTELVTNALQHTTGGAVLTATLTAGADAAWQEQQDPPAPESAAVRTPRRLRVEVHDSLARRPGADTAQREAAAAQAGEHGTSGRGLLLVQALADAWGAQPHGSGKVVWFELNTGTA